MSALFYFSTFAIRVFVLLIEEKAFWGYSLWGLAVVICRLSLWNEDGNVFCFAF